FCSPPATTLANVAPQCPEKSRPRSSRVGRTPKRSPAAPFPSHHSSRNLLSARSRQDEKIRKTELKLRSLLMEFVKCLRLRLVSLDKEQNIKAISKKAP